MNDKVEILEGTVYISEQEGGHSPSCLQIGDVKDFVNWFVKKYGEFQPVKYGAPEQEINGIFKISIEKGR